MRTNTHLSHWLWILCIYCFIPNATWAADPKVQRRSDFETQLRRAHATLQAHPKMKPNTRTPAGRIVKEINSEASFSLRMGIEMLERFKEGQPLDRYLFRVAYLTGLDKELETFLETQGTNHAQARAQRVLEEMRNPAGDRVIEPMVQGIYAHHFWKQHGFPRKASAALRSARVAATARNLDVTPLLNVPMAFDIVRGGKDGGFHARGLNAKPNRIYGDDPSQRVPGRHHLWWTGTPAAYLDLAYRRMPELIVQRYREFTQRKADQARTSTTPPTIKIWHAGFEDGSQTMFLASAMDEAIARLKTSRPEMTPFLEQLQVEIVASDLMQKVSRRGRQIRFGETDVVRNYKGPLVLSEFGRDESTVAAREIAEIESRGALDSGDPQVMQQLADVGKVGQLLGRFLEFDRIDSRVSPVQRLATGGDRDANFIASYRLTNRSWRIEDTLNRGTLNPRAKGRTIRFVRSDLTKESAVAEGSADLVVCTHVLQYLGLYGVRSSYNESATLVGRAVDNMARALRPNGAMLSDDMGSRDYLKTFGQTNPDKKLWLTTEQGVIDEKR